MSEQQTRTIAVGEIEDDGPLQIPIEDLLTGRSFFCGKSGSGKSNSVGVIAEELLDEELPLLIIDTDGEYFGLKEEYEVLHAAAPDAENADVYVGPEHGERLARLALEENVPIILDVSDFIDEDVVDELVLETLRHLFAIEKDLRRPFLVVIEEIHEYIPQSGSLDDVGDMIRRIAKRGRKRGIGVVGLSQRPASVDKDFITQADLLVWHRLTWDNDLQVVSRVLGKQYRDPVQDLENGQAFVMSDWFDELLRAQFREKRTYDAGATPGLDDVDRPELKSVGEGLVEELEQISEQESQRQDRIEQLEARLEERDEKIEQLEADLEDARDLQRLGEAFIDAAEGRGGSGDVDREILEEKNARIRELEKRLEEEKDDRANLLEQVDELNDELEQLEAYRERVEEAERIEERFEAVEHWLDQAPDVIGLSGDVDERLEELRRRLSSREELIETLKDELEAKEEQLEQASQEGAILEPISNYEEFLEEEPVRDAIDDAKEADGVTPRYVKGILASIIDNNGPATYAEVMDRLGIKTKSHIQRAANALEARKVVELLEKNGEQAADLNTDGLNEVRFAAQRRGRTQELMEDL